MFGKARVRKRWLAAAAVLAIAQTANVTVEAQLFWDQQYQSKRTRPQAGGFFQNFFGRDNSRSSDDEYSPPQQRRERQLEQQSSESSRAPPPHKADSKVEPTTSIVVMGDDMADWLAYGLENVFSDSAEIGIVRKNKLYSGLLRYDAKNDLDWWHVARDTLVREKPDYVVMMLGVADRQDIRGKDLVKEAETKAKDQQAKDEAEKKNGLTAKTNETDEIGAAASQPGKKARGDAGFRTDEWAKIYSRRIDETIVALKSKGVPVIWVGLPPIRGVRSTADAAFLNDLYRARAERAGITYIDVWDGFADEAGKYSNYGPDYEGQMRRLRLSDGVFFTKYGAAKLAHYVERELRHYMSNRVSVALPSGPVEPSSSESKSTDRPLAGPVIPLTGTSNYKDSEELLGAPGSSPMHGDAVATKVLTKGETMAAPRERADNFAWPQGGDTQSAQSALPPPVPVQPKAVPDAATSALASAPTENTQEMRKKGGAGKLVQKTTKNPTRAESVKPRPLQDDVPRPPLPIGPSSGPFNRTP
jgi:uncharacterized protein